MRKTKLLFNIIVILTLVLMTIGNPSMVAQAGNKKDEPKADPRLLQMAAENPKAVFMVIVQREVKNKNVQEDNPETEVEKGGGKIKKQFRLVESFSAELTGKQIIKLAKKRKVRWISADALMVSTVAAGMEAVRDEFTSKSYSGNNGTVNWATNWMESESTTINLGAQKDSYIANSSSASLGNGTCAGLGVANTTTGIIRRPLYQFDLSAIPTGATIVSATMSLRTNLVDKAPTTVNAHRVTSDWDEGTTCAASGTANWNNRKAGAAWAKAGGDYDSAAAASVALNSTSVGTYSFGLATLVQGWVNGAYPNYGVLLNRPVKAGAGEITWRSKEAATSGEKPTLQVTYMGDNGGSAGKISLVTGASCKSGTGSCLSVSNTNVGDNVSRTADLSNVASATLSFWRNNLLAGLNNNDSIALEISTDGANWTALRTWKDVKEDIGISYESFDISSYISANTRIRFRVATRANNGYINFDNIQIAFARPSAFLPTIKADQLSLNGSGVTVAVVDSGLTTKNDDFISGGISRIVTEQSFGNQDSVKDLYGHGTHVAGVIAGNGAASNGLYRGVAPEANLVNLKVSDKDGMTYESSLIDSLQWVYDNKDTYNIRVVNISMNSTVAQSYHTSPLDAAVEILWLNGIVVVVSAGNNGTGNGPVTIYPPANDPFVITVGATEDKGTGDLADDNLAVFSAYGVTDDGYPKPDLVAPGRNVVAPISEKASTVYNAHPLYRVGDDYFRMSGTSMSAPMVSGAIAMLLQNEPDLTPDQVKYRLLATTNQDWSGYAADQSGAGYLDVYAAVNSTTTESANTGIMPSLMLATGDNSIDFNSVGWNSVGWNSVGWNSVGWNSVGWNSVGWNSVGWNSVGWASACWDDEEE